MSEVQRSPLCEHGAGSPPTNAQCKGSCWLPDAQVEVCSEHGLCGPCHDAPGPDRADFIRRVRARQRDLNEEAGGEG